MKYTLLPMIEIDELESALEIQYGEDFIAEIQSEFGSLRQLLFDDRYMNDVCLKYSFGTFSKGETIQDRLENCVKAFLMDATPDDYVSVIIDVSW